MPVCSATCDIVTEVTPRSATSAAVVLRMASRTSLRCASIVSFHSLGTISGYAEPRHRRYVLTETKCLVKDGAMPQRTEGTPRWVKVTGIVVGILILLVVLMMLLSKGKHGRGRHMPSGGLAPVEGRG